MYHKRVQHIIKIVIQKFWRWCGGVFGSNNGAPMQRAQQATFLGIILKLKNTPGVEKTSTPMAGEHSR